MQPEFFDMILVHCPSCDNAEAVKTKLGACEFNLYDLYEAPEKALFDVNKNSPFTCNNCGAIFTVAFNNGIPFEKQIGKVQNLKHSLEQLIEEED